MNKRDKYEQDIKPDAKKYEVTAEMQKLIADYQNEKSAFVKDPLIVE